MAAILTIRDGSTYWWDSPDIWVVPGSDPNGLPGQPIAGQPAFLWARVANTGMNVNGAKVNFYWCNPSTGVLRSQAILINSSFVDLNTGQTKEVLCVTPWIPVIVNGGHECLVAEVIHSADPLPQPLPDAFSPKDQRQIAQKNLTVLVANRRMLSLLIQLDASPREDRELHLSIITGGEVEKELLMQSGLAGLKPAKEHEVKTAFSVDNDCDTKPGAGKQEMTVRLKKGESRGIYLNVWPGKVDSNTYLPITVIAREGKEKEYGGITYLLISEKNK